MSCRSLTQKERGFFLNIETSAISLNYEMIMRQPDPSRMCKNWGSKVQKRLSKDQVHNFTRKRWNSTKRISHLIIPRERRIGNAQHWTEERVLQEDRMRNLQEIWELNQLCCTEAERVKHLRRDDRSIQEKESRSSVKQLTIQIQKFQDNLNSLNDSRECNDRDTASNSGLSRVPSHPWSIPSPRGMLSRDSCLQPDTQDLSGRSGNVLGNSTCTKWTVTSLFRKF